jgi:glucose/mannose transport system substrate-binding protein
MAAVFQAAADARELSQGSNVQDWNQATNMVITGKAGGQSMGDWAQGEFQVAGQTAGKEYSCLPGLGMPDAYITTGGDSFYFPLLDDPEKSAAQEVLATVMLSPETQVAFNLKKGSMPVRGDIDLSAANDCMKKGLEILKSGNVIKSTDELISPDTTTQINDLMSQFFNDTSITKEDAQKRFAEIIGSAE